MSNGKISNSKEQISAKESITKTQTSTRANAKLSAKANAKSKSSMKSNRKKSTAAEIKLDNKIDVNKINEADTIKAGKIILNEIQEFNKRKKENKYLYDESIPKIKSSSVERNRTNGIQKDIKISTGKEKQYATDFKKELMEENDFNAVQENNNNYLMDSEKLNEIHTELISSKDKNSIRTKTKYMEMFKNLLIAIIIVVYFALFIVANKKMQVIQLINPLKISSLVCLVCGLILFENAYYKDREQLFANAVEISGLGICTLYILSKIAKQSEDIKLIFPVMIASFVAYYIIKVIFIRVKNN